jgi:hypothetical protein
MNKLLRYITIWVAAFAFTTTSQAGLLDALLPRPSTVIGVAAVGAAVYASKHCKTVKDRETGQSTLVCKSPNIVKSEGAPKEEKPSLLDPTGEEHILEGDATGGGHRSGTGNPGKSEFPQSWSDEKIAGEISDVATDPDSKREPGRRGRTVVNDTRDGVDIEVIVEPNGRIVTGYPKNTHRNPK